MNGDAKDSLLLRILWAMVALAMVAVPLVFSPHGREGFRIPKLAIFQGVGLLIAGVLVAGAILGWLEPSPFRRLRGAFVLAGAILFWTAFTALFSRVPRISWESFVTVLCAVAFFVATTISSQRRSLRIVIIPTVAAVVNAIVLMLQWRGMWAPVQTTESGRLALVGLLGNPNDVAMFLVGPVIAAAGLIVVGRGPLRWWGVAATAAMMLALVLTESTTGVAAASVGLMVMGLVALLKHRSRRHALAIALGAVVVAGAFVGTPRLLRLFEMFGTGGLDTLLTGRLSAFASAFEMVRHQPLVGVGPGMFQWHYFDFAPIAEKIHGPFLYASARAVYFSEAHNDHLQLAAEAGIPGLALFWASLSCASVWTLRARGTNERQQFARMVGTPLASALFVLALAQFPLQLPASLLVLVVIFGMCIGWSSGDESSRPSRS